MNTALAMPTVERANKTSAGHPISKADGPAMRGGGPSAAGKGEGTISIEVETARQRLETATRRSLAHADRYFAEGQLGAAADFLGLANLTMPDRADIASALGSVRFQLGQFAEAGEAFVAAARLTPMETENYVKLAIVHERLGHTQEYLDILHFCLKVNPQEPDALHQLGNYYRDQKDYRQAAQLYGRLLPQRQNDVEVLLSLGKCFYHIGDVETAVTVFEQTLIVDPKNEIAKESLSIIRTGRAEYRPATPTPPAPKSETKSFDQYLAEADAAYARNDTISAMAALRQALQLRPNSVEILATLGSLEYVGKNHRAAANYLSRACELQPKNVSFLVKLAMAKLMLNDLESANELLSQAHSLDSKHPELLQVVRMMQPAGTARR